MLTHLPPSSLRILPLPPKLHSGEDHGVEWDGLRVSLTWNEAYMSVLLQQ